ncbi:MAG TPA: type IV pili twitching motility protein PilT, partial [Burkholderiales bacterium]|nr:type IV pili twitching motility protein PilT [Burkholderiales bacterium]
MFVKPLFKLMAETHASDLFFTAGSPIQIKIKGDVVPVNSTVFDAAGIKRIVYETMTDDQVAHF